MCSSDLLIGAITDTLRLELQDFNVAPEMATFIGAFLADILASVPDSCLSLLLPSLGNENKPVYGFCDFLILFLSDTSIHGRCPPANLLH